MEFRHSDVWPPSGPRGYPPSLPLKRGGRERVEIGAGDQDERGAVERVFRFSEEAAREEVAVAPGVQGVDKDDVGVATQAAMLEAVPERGST